MEKVFQIAIDGPSGAGKSTIAKELAKALCIDYIDTGAMYRAVAYKMLQKRIDLSEKDAIKVMLKNTDINFSKGETVLDGKVISDQIRTPEISRLASTVSALTEVREKLVASQRDMGSTKSVIMDGRDIGTNVFPKAKYKFFLTASVEERARRRWQELKEKGQPMDLSQVVADIEERDRNDSMRVLNPLRKAEDAVVLDTTGFSIEEVTAFILKMIN
ncbi:MAG: (d)CMP kinase [Eubacteriales bacterium]|nr:(d)CMP kinase [Eubacteriales bacterium]MDD4584180.1 (d)CMP kinase [Eubacteriales bacterium]